MVNKMAESKKDLDFIHAQDEHKFDKIEQLDINNKLKTSFLTMQCQLSLQEHYQMQEMV